MGLAWRAPVDVTWCGDADVCQSSDYVIKIDPNDRVRLSRVLRSERRGPLTVAFDTRLDVLVYSSSVRRSTPPRLAYGLCQVL